MDAYLASVDRETRIGKNEELFRQLNEKIESINRSFGTVSELMLVVCECGNQECIEQIEMSIPEYEEIRSDVTSFAVKPGHEESDVEQVVAKKPGYWTIKKRPGAPARIAQELDTRER